MCDLTDNKDDPPPSLYRYRHSTVAAAAATPDKAAHIKEDKEEDIITPIARGHGAGYSAAYRARRATINIVDHRAYRAHRATIAL